MLALSYPWELFLNIHNHYDICYPENYIISPVLPVRLFREQIVDYYFSSIYICFYAMIQNELLNILFPVIS